MDRLYRVLLGDAGDIMRIEAAMLSGAISGAVMHPLLAHVDDETLGTRLTVVSRRFLGLKPYVAGHGSLERVEGDILLPVTSLRSRGGDVGEVVDVGLAGDNVG